MHSCCNGVTSLDLGSSGYCAELFQQEFFTRADGSLGWSAPGAYCFNGYLVEACIDTTATASRTTLSLGEVHLTRGKADKDLSGQQPNRPSREGCGGAIRVRESAMHRTSLQCASAWLEAAG